MFGDSVLFKFKGPMRIPVEIHSSYLQLVLIIALISLNNPVSGGIFLVLLTLSIFAHEFGHAWACKAQGVQVRRVVIHGGGGFCEHSGRTHPRQEEFIVAMGPLVNLIIWAVASAVAQTGILGTGGITNAILSNLAILNLFLFIFNLLPIQPLDGGKLLNLVLLRFVKPIQAVRVTGFVGLVASCIWVPVAILLLIYAGFILFFIPNFKHHYMMWKAGR